MKYTKEYITELIDILKMLTNSETFKLAGKLVEKFMEKNNITTVNKDRVFLYEGKKIKVFFDCEIFDTVGIDNEGWVSHFGLYSNSSDNLHEHRQKRLSIIIQTLKHNLKTMS